MKRRHHAPCGAAHTHPRNRYGSEKPDFAALAASYPAFARYVTLDHSVAPAKATLDWKAPGAVVALTQSLLHRDFGLAWELPPGRLCPGITCRANYIHWVEDLIALGSGGARGAAAPRGVDIGTGGSCIFPLMGNAMHGWTFVATDIDPVALEAAQRNVARNGMQRAVSLRLVRSELLRGRGRERVIDEPQVNAYRAAHRTLVEWMSSEMVLEANHLQVRPERDLPNAVRVEVELIFVNVLHVRLHREELLESRPPLALPLVRLSAVEFVPHALHVEQRRLELPFRLRE